jgi:hypothetical protein
VANVKPYKGDTDNVLYFRLVSGQTIRATATGDVKLTFTLPSGYKCKQTPVKCPIPGVPCKIYNSNSNATQDLAFFKGISGS